MVSYLEGPVNMKIDPRRTRRRARSILALVLLAGFAASGEVYAQRGQAAGPAPAQSGRAAAFKDLTGYWVSVVTQNWHLRMLMPPKGDFTLLPLTPEARKVAAAWDPAKDKAARAECRAYGPPAIMQIPSRLHIHWANDNTLQVDVDSGTQTRLFRFGNQAPSAQSPQWQGHSVATWVRPQGVPVRDRVVKADAGGLRVVTTRMRPGYLRKNGVPYSENATVEEYFDMFTEPNGDTWLVVTSMVSDPQYLTRPYLTSANFKKLPNNAGWDPTPCSVDEPR